MTFYQVMTLASLVEREARLDKERPLIAGVFQNRLNPKLFPLGEFQSDVTIFYIHDSLQLAKTSHRRLGEVHVLGTGRTASSRASRSRPPSRATTRTRARA